MTRYQIFLSRNNIIIIILFSIFFIINNVSMVSAKELSINSDVGPNQIIFISKAPLEDINGVIQKNCIHGKISFDIKNIENSKGNILVDVTGMETGIKLRDGHLQSSDWLDSKKYPQIIFELQKITSFKIENQSGGKIIISGNAEGNISIHGKIKWISSPISITYLYESPETRSRASGDLMFVEGKFDVMLKDFDVAGVRGLVGSKVGEVIKIEYKLYFNGI